MVGDALGKDIFLCHAAADKQPYVRPFATELDRRRIAYWLDEAEIQWGDKISVRINEGLRLAEFVVVFLSKAFIGRNWTEAELASALNRENAEGRTVVLPIVIGDAPQLLARYPLLRDKAYVPWDLGINGLADELQKVAHRPWTKAELDQFIIDNVDLEQFPQKEVWGPKYRLLLARTDFGEGAHFFWNEESGAVERYWLDAVRSHGTTPLSADDIRLVRTIVVKRRKRQHV